MKKVNGDELQRRARRPAPPTPHQWATWWGGRPWPPTGEIARSYGKTPFCLKMSKNVILSEAKNLEFLWT